MKNKLLIIFLCFMFFLTACNNTDLNPVSEPQNVIDEPSTKTEDGRGDLIKNDTNEWVGVYVNRDLGFSVEIEEFEGTDFWFDVYLLRDGHQVLGGTASVTEDDDNLAMMDDIGLYLYEDLSAIDFLAPESSEWEHMRGQYIRLTDEEPSAAAATAILIADFADGPDSTNCREYTWEYEGALDIAVLSDGLSSTTGLDFFVNGEIAGDKAFIAWLDAGTLVAGLGDREQKEEFFFYDSVSLNWFMMDSMATTIKTNFPEVTEVYFSGENGEPVMFPNPEDMASQGLPILPVDLPYEGSAFFIAHADGRGDDLDTE
ncbi:hypothetical protein [Sedimentibacter sp.]|uniref:hypothetical protein n=1 Tax=Sedimentibacter sp. TaxID=1960295 RepID=UPI0028988C17|nr:hypothetical protein [Sedimentibacter sp.]